MTMAKPDTTQLGGERETGGVLPSGWSRGADSGLRTHTGKPVMVPPVPGLVPTCKTTRNTLEGLSVNPIYDINPQIQLYNFFGFSVV